MKTEIYATFGPACGEEAVLREMVEAGMTGMRLNLSHTTLAASEGWIRAYQRAARAAGTEPKILIDMQGPELRVGQLAEPLFLEEGQQIVLGQGGLSVPEEVVTRIDVPVPAAAVAVMRAGDEVLLDDGKIQLEVLRAGDGTAEARVIRGGCLKGKKSLKIRDRDVEMPVLTEHDKENIRAAKAYGVTALMQPFVRSGRDLEEVRAVLRENGAAELQIFAKIENRAGVERLEEILPAADLAVIARGDLGNDMPLWELPAVQKQIEGICHRLGKPYIVVTQMLASMETSPVPTRAEVSDIFHAVYHGAAGVMVTGETAVGRYPAEAVRYLANTAAEAVRYRANTAAEAGRYRASARRSEPRTLSGI